MTRAEARDLRATIKRDNLDQDRQPFRIVKSIEDRKGTYTKDYFD